MLLTFRGAGGVELYRSAGGLVVILDLSFASGDSSKIIPPRDAETRLR